MQSLGSIYNGKNGDFSSNTASYDSSVFKYTESLKITANSATISNVKMSAGKDITLNIKNVKCKASIITAPHIYVEKSANFGSCKLNGEVHINDLQDFSEPKKEVLKEIFTEYMEKVNRGTKRLFFGNEDMMKFTREKAEEEMISFIKEAGLEKATSFLTAFGNNLESVGCPLSSIMNAEDGDFPVTNCLGVMKNIGMELIDEIF